jgi:N-acetylglucosamine PTS system EIICBA or EIICB component
LRSPAASSAPPLHEAFDQMLRALGGRANIQAWRGNSSRLFVEVRDPAAVDEKALSSAVRAVGRPAARSIHLVIGPAAAAWVARFEALAG